LRRPPQATDSNKHTTTRPMDGMPRSYYEEMRLSAIGTHTTGWIVDRRVTPHEFWDHLPRLSCEQNYKEWSELPHEYAALYEWNSEKYIMKKEFRECWGRE